MNINICEIEKEKFLKAYDCYDWQGTDSLAEVLTLIPDSDFPMGTSKNQ